MRLKGKVALITGAGSGIGRATTMLFYREGARVAANGRRAENLNETVEMARREGGEIIGLVADVSQFDEVLQLVARVTEAFGKIDVLFNCAGVGYSSKYSMGSVIDTSVQDWLDVIGINLNSVFYTAKAVLPFMMNNNGGAIINCSSINGVIGCGAHAYSASKGGIDALTRALAVEFGKYNIRVNTVSPGPTATPMIEKALENRKFREFWNNASPMKRIALPEEVARTVLFLASDEASFITGQNILVDGGLTIS